jgi:hypothetical protein
MSEEKLSYMQQLDGWTNGTVIKPLAKGLDYMREYEDPASYEVAVESVQKAIREKVLESYKNGFKAGAAKVGKERNAQAQTR